MSLEQGQKSHQQCLNPCTPSAFPWDQRLQSASADREHIKFKAIVTNSGNGLKKMQCLLMEVRPLQPIGKNHPECGSEIEDHSQALIQCSRLLLEQQKVGKTLKTWPWKVSDGADPALGARFQDREAKNPGVFHCSREGFWRMRILKKRIGWVDCDVSVIGYFFKDSLGYWFFFQ